MKTPYFFAPMLAVAVSFGCDGSLGIDQLPHGSPDAGPTPVTYVDAVCGACARSNCKKEIAACTADSGCDRLYRCVVGCAKDDPACRARCEQADSVVAAAATYLAADGCQRSVCASNCYAGGLLRMWDERCACVDDVCAAESLACARSGFDRPGETVGACERRWACARDPKNPDRGAECFFTSREGDAEVQALRYCAARSVCGTCPMSGGHALACVGGYAWSVPREKIIAYGFIARSFAGATPFPGLTVKVCDPFDVPACASPKDTATTDADGLVTLHVPIPPTGFVGCFDVRGTGIYPALVCNGYPLVRAENIRGVNLLTQSEGDLLLASAGGDPTRGHLAVTAFDCAWNQVVGATIEVSPSDAATHVIYLRDRKLDPTALATGIDGIASVVNLVPGSVRITVKVNGGVVAQTNTTIRAGTLTVVVLPPSSISL